MPHIMGHTSLLQAVYKEISSLHMVFATNPIFGVEFTVEDPVSGLAVHTWCLCYASVNPVHPPGSTTKGSMCCLQDTAPLLRNFFPYP